MRDYCIFADQELKSREVFALFATMPRENDLQRFKRLDFFLSNSFWHKCFEDLWRLQSQTWSFYSFRCSTSETSTPNTDLYNLQNPFNGAGDFLGARSDAVRKVSVRVSRAGGQSQHQMITGCGTSSLHPFQHGGCFQKIGGKPPKWMVYNGKPY